MAARRRCDFWRILAAAMLFAALPVFGADQRPQHHPGPNSTASDRWQPAASADRMAVPARPGRVVLPELIVDLFPQSGAARARSASQSPRSAPSAVNTAAPATPAAADPIVACGAPPPGSLATAPPAVAARRHHRRIRARRGAGDGRWRRGRGVGAGGRLRPRGPVAARLDAARLDGGALRHSRRPPGRRGARTACRRRPHAGARTQPYLRPAAGGRHAELCLPAHRAEARQRQRRKRPHRRHRYRHRRDASGAEGRRRGHLRRHAGCRGRRCATTALPSPG